MRLSLPDKGPKYPKKARLDRVGERRYACILALLWILPGMCDWTFDIDGDRDQQTFVDQGREGREVSEAVDGADVGNVHDSILPYWLAYWLVREKNRGGGGDAGQSLSPHVPLLHALIL